MRLKIGVGVLLAVSAVGLAALGAERADARSWKQANEERIPVESGFDLLVQELETLPDDVTVQLTEDAYPEVYQFFQGKIAAKDEAARSPSKAAGCCSGDSLRLVPTTGGMLGTLDKGNGVVHVLAYTIDDENLDPEQTNGLALSAIITEDGVEVLWMDMDRLARFVGAEQRVTAVADGGIASVDEEGSGGGAADVDMDCDWTSERVCCAVATETKFCVCCASLIPVRVGCGCAPLPTQ